MSGAWAIRTATESDFPAIDGVVGAAFGRDEEVDLVRHLRTLQGVWAPELEWVAEEPDGGQVVGHIMFTWVDLTDEDSAVHRVLQLAPLAVTPELHGRGIGGDLTRAGLAAARGAGAPLVTIMGHPEYYPRFGFVLMGHHGLRYDPEGISPAFMVHPLDAPTPRLRGTVRLWPQS